MKVLLLSRNSIEHLLDNLPTIERLSINDNHLRTLSVVNMKRLRVLEASGNRLDSMPHGVYNLPDLEVLRLSGNRIGYVSQDIVLLRRLRILDLSNNVLKLLPQAIEEMEQLESLVISGNNVRMKKRPFDQTAYLLTSADPTDAIHNQMVQTLRRSDEGSYQDDGLRLPPNSPSHPQVNGFIAGGRNPFQRTKEKSKHLVKPTEPVQRTEDQGLVRSREWLLSGQSNTSPVRSFSSRQTAESGNRRRSPRIEDRGDRGDRGNRGNRGEQWDLTDREAVLLSNPLSVEEITYPVIQTDVLDERRDDIQGVLDLGGAAFERRQESKRRNRRVAAKQLAKSGRVLDGAALVRGGQGGHSLSDVEDNASDTVTVNDAIGDELSLGDEDFEFLPLTIKDDKLMRMAGEIETMLNDQLLQPIISGSYLFKKRFDFNPRHYDYGDI